MVSEEICKIYVVALSGISPVLANVFLHYAPDPWFHRKWRPSVPAGGAIIVRYADDVVAGFQHKRDAERYLHDVRERLARFGFSLHPDKTRLVEFGRFAVMNRRGHGTGKTGTFDFPGFTHYCTTTGRGRFRLGRKPVAKRVNRTLARIDEVLCKRWHRDIREVGGWLGRVYRGWLNYFAVPGSGRFLRAFPHRLQRLWMRAIRRRSQRARFDWRRLERMTEILWPRASIYHPWPDQRFAVNHPRQEPDGPATTSGSARGMHSNAHSCRNSGGRRATGVPTAIMGGISCAAPCRSPAPSPLPGARPVLASLRFPPERRGTEAQGHLVPTVEGAVVLPGAELDGGVLRRVEREPPEVLRAVIRAACAGLAPGRPLRRQVIGLIPSRTSSRRFAPEGPADLTDSTTGPVTPSRLTPTGLGTHGAVGPSEGLRAGLR